MIALFGIAVFLIAVFGPSAYFVAASRLSLWLRGPLAALMGGLACLGLAIMAVACWIVWEHYRDLPQEVVIAQMQHCADKWDQPAVFAELQRLGYECSENEGPYRDEFVKVSDDLVARSTSSVDVYCSHVRHSYFGSKVMMVAFLFDADKHLLGWTYWLDEQEPARM